DRRALHSFPTRRSSDLEPVLAYAMGSKERRLLQQALQAALADQADIPMFIGGKEVRTERTVPIRPPHAHKQVLGHFHYGDKSHRSEEHTSELQSRENLV